MARTLKVLSLLVFGLLSEDFFLLSSAKRLRVPDSSSDLHSSTGTPTDGTAPTGLQKRAESSPSGHLSGVDADVAKPKLFFLFMVYVKINNEDVWDRFFAGAARGVEYQALVHCKSEASCRANIKAQHRFEIISSVETQYCFNLVGGMNALLKAALLRSRSGNAKDKFIFVSDSTLPVKPFAHMHERLTADDASDFCVFPRNEWAEISETYLNAPQHTAITRVAVKHHQWIILSRRHAMESVSSEGDYQHLMSDFQLNMGFRNTGCLDEFWHFMVIFKSFKLNGHPMTVHLQGFNGGPLTTSNYEIQGRCNTFVHWVPRASGTSNNVTFLARELQEDPGTEMVPATETRPASLGRLSRHALKKLRGSPFLFVRKVEDKCAFSGCGDLAEAFGSFVFSEDPKVKVTMGPWRGDGTWLDTRRSLVTITSQDGALQLTGTDAGMEAKGSYCKNRIAVVFQNGFEAEATLSDDGVLLHWSNGVTWGRQQPNSNSSSTSYYGNLAFAHLARDRQGTRS